jgi:predicted ATPase
MARQHFETGLAHYDPERDRARAARLGYDVSVACHSYLGFVLWDQGFPDEALRHSEEAITAGRAACHPLSEAYALYFAAFLHQCRGEVALCLERGETALALATEQVLPFWAASAMVCVGSALVRQGRTKEGLARLRAGIEGSRTIGSRLVAPYWLPVLAEACLVAGGIEEGLSAVREGLTATEETEARYCEAELHRLAGELLLASSEPDERGAEASFTKAIAIARAHEAKSWELRAATSLARLLARLGRPEEARAVLAPVYDWFTEGFDTADLKEAKALLDGLA